MEDKKPIYASLAVMVIALTILASTVAVGYAYNGEKTKKIGKTEEITEKANSDELSIKYVPEESVQDKIPADENTVNAEEEIEADESKEVIEVSAETTPETDEAEAEQMPETESKETENSMNETDISDTDELTDGLMALFESEAPLKWAKNESGEFVRVYPELSFAYYDIASGDSITYNSEEVRYSASLIKAPYVYSVLSEIEEFEKTCERDENGEIIYTDENKKYDLSEKWVYNSATMLAEGSGKIMEEKDGFELTWGELIDYALLYSDNVAFAQLRERFGYSYFYNQMNEIGVYGIKSGFMNLSVDDCVAFMKKLNEYFDTESEYAAHMKECMSKSKHLEMICSHYDEGMAAHKYGWDIGAFHDMALVFDEHPYILVIMTDYEDGGEEPLDFFEDVTEYVKKIHSVKYKS